MERGGLLGAGATTFEINTLAFQLRTTLAISRRDFVGGWGRILGRWRRGDAGRVEVSGRYATGCGRPRTVEDVSLGLLALVDRSAGRGVRALSNRRSRRARVARRGAHGCAMLDDMDTPGLTRG